MGVRRLDVDVGGGLSLHVVLRGTGPRLLLLHGFTGSHESWSSLVQSLSGSFSTIAVDLPGHGNSSAPPDPAWYSLLRFSEQLSMVLDAVGAAGGQVAVLGYSLGGRAALRFALEHRERVSALVLESASPGIEDESERTVRMKSDRELADSIEWNGVEAFVDHWEQLPLWRSQSDLPKGVRDALRALRLRNRAIGLANSLRGAGAAAERPLGDRLAALDLPALVIAGALDEKYVALGRKLCTTLPNATLEVVPGTGHAVHLEQPEVFSTLVAGFLSKTAAKSGSSG